MAAVRMSQVDWDEDLERRVRCFGRHSSDDLVASERRSAAVNVPPLAVRLSVVRPPRTPSTDLRDLHRSGHVERYGARQRSRLGAPEQRRPRRRCDDGEGGRHRLAVEHNGSSGLILAALWRGLDAAEDEAMTENNRFKQAVRDRMARTGENYTAARAALLAERDGGGTTTMTRPSWEQLAQMEPLLLEVEAQIQRVKDNPERRSFCANSAWLNGNFKDEVVRLVGWHRGTLGVDIRAGSPKESGVLTISDLEELFGGVDDLKEQRKQRETAAGFGVLWTDLAYDVAYEHLYEQLPECRNCLCW
jgi:hypothetical protein